ncbi:MAG: propionyl-CoA synthetase, partial [Thiomonas sp. 20-64-9]
MIDASYADFYRRSVDSPEAFWGEQAQAIDWKKPWNSVLDRSRPPFSAWFSGGLTNLCHNAVDRHLPERAGQAALVYVSTEAGQEVSYSYAELHREVQIMAASLQSLGVTQGDRVLIYMPMIPEAVFAMLACVRLGAVHSVVFGGFASVSLAARIDDAQPKVIVSADAGSRAGKVVSYKPLLDEALRLSQHPPEQVIVVDRGLADWARQQPRDVSYADLRTRHARAEVPCVWVDSTHPSYILYTS